MSRTKNPLYAFVTKAAAVESFGTGEAAAILRVPVWRLQKFLDSPNYQLSPEGHLGRGRGSRRVFSRGDLYRLAIASRLVQDGLAAKTVGSVVEQIEDYELQPSYDENGNERPAPSLLGLIRGPQGPRPWFYNSAPKFGERDSPYYLLNLDEVTGEIDTRITEQAKRR